MGVLRFAGCLVALVGTAVCSAAPMATQTDRQPAPRITSSSPQVRLPLTPRPNAAAPLTLRVTAIKNPDQIPISLQVSLAPCSASGTWAPERVAVLGVF